jgi:hypothetical protein
MHIPPIPSSIKRPFLSLYLTRYTIPSASKRRFHKPKHPTPLPKLLLSHLIVRHLIRRLPHNIQKDRALLHLNLLLAIHRLRRTLAILLRHKLDINAIHAANQLGLEDGLALLLAALVAGAGAAAVNPRGDRDAVDFKRLVAVDEDEEAVEAVGECDGDAGRDLEVRVAGGHDDGGAVFRLALVGEDVDGPWLGEVERGVSVEGDLWDQGFVDAWALVSLRS